MSTRFGSSGVPIERLDVSAYKIPTDAPESDGTYQWEATTLVLVEVTAGGRTGLGYTLCRHGDGRSRPRPAGGRRPRVRRDGRAAGVVGDAARDPQPRPAGDRLDGDLGRRRRRSGT